MTKRLQDVPAAWVGLRVWCHGFPAKSNMAEGGRLEFRRMSIFPDWMNISNFI